MPDLPELPESTKRKLALQWTTVLDEHGLTGEHLHWHASERERLRRVAAICGGDSGWRETAVDDTGIQPTVETAKERFSDLCGEYRRRWLSSGDGYEVFAAWLDILTQQTSDEVASVWKGRSKAFDRWYKRACGPAVADALTTEVDTWTRRALAEELKRLERGSIEDALPKANLAGTTPPIADKPTRTEAGPAGRESTIAGRKRGRPQTIPDERKAKAVKLKESGGTNRDVAAVLYDKRFPTPQEVRNVHSILLAYSKKSKRSGPSVQASPRFQNTKG